ncbi:MAG: type I DNA topoisomerase [Bacteroidales bacterium]|nr:type I DNA topoisomerase [Bacteroidales bacterium]
MGENLVIVESPAKAKTIGNFLGKGYVVKSSYGHIRDLTKNNDSIDVQHGFAPKYEISADKKKVVADLKKAAEKASMVWLASDEDREGEAIAWHIFDTLQLERGNTKRIAFHEITRNAILAALENPRDIDMDLVMAQQARRVLDRLVGFELSPILWRKVQGNLSAGRVQSVAVRLIVDREREIAAYDYHPYFRVGGVFTAKGSRSRLRGVLDRKFATAEESRAFLDRCIGCNFYVGNIDTKEGVKSPAAPFTTSVLQQEAARKLGFSVSATMQVAQGLYERGLITYMRTDSVNLSSLAINTAKEFITANFGAAYSHPRQYKTRSKGAQEAHEAIRPTYIQNTQIEGTAAEKKLYDLIWKRTIASQMSDARIERTTVDVNGSNIEEKFVLEAEKVLFDGFLKVYIEGRDDDNAEDMAASLPALEIGQTIQSVEIEARERLTQGPQHYSEATLVKKLEELGIGRPSTYAPTISTIFKRGYIVRGDVAGSMHTCTVLTLKGGEISTTTVKEAVGKEKKKLLPENIGIVVTDYLAANFPEILDYNFTAKVEEDFDDIAKGHKVWNEVIGEFYAPFHATVSAKMADNEYSRAERLIGVDPASGKPVYARMGRYSPIVQKGASDDPGKQFAGMKKGQLIETITLEEALKLFDLPRTVGTFEGSEIVAAIGKFGPYIKHGGKFYSLDKTLSPYTVTEEQAAEVIREKRAQEQASLIAAFPEHDIEVRIGRFGPYIKHGGKNYKIPKNADPKKLSAADCIELINNQNK